MKKASIIGWMLLALFGSVAASRVSPARAAGTSTPSPATKGEVVSDDGFYVLCYHRFWEEPKKKGKAAESCYEMPPAEFLWQMRYLKEHGFTVINEVQLMDYWSKGTPLPRRSVLLSFDDGFRTIYRDAYPVVKDLGYPSTLFLYSQFVEGARRALERDKQKGRKPKVKPRVEALTPEDIVEMGNSGMMVEAHTANHLNLGLEREKVGTEAFRKKLAYELTEPLDYVQKTFGRRPQWLAYPFGVYDPFVLQATKEAGYQMAFTVNPGPNDRTMSPLMLKRNLVLYPIGHEAFAKMFEDKVLHVKDLTPADGSWIDPVRPVVSTRIEDDIDPKSVRLQIGNHFMKVRYDPRTGVYSHAVQADLAQGGHILAFSAKDRQGGHRVYNWYFRVKHRRAVKGEEGKDASNEIQVP